MQVRLRRTVQQSGPAPLHKAATSLTSRPSALYRPGFVAIPHQTRPSARGPGCTCAWVHGSPSCVVHRRKAGLRTMNASSNASAQPVAQGNSVKLEPPAPEQGKVVPMDPSLNVILPPLPADTSGSAPQEAQQQQDCLLVLVPGVGLTPQDYLATVQGIQAQCRAMRMWVALMHIDWLALWAEHSPSKTAELEEVFGLLTQRRVFHSALEVLVQQARQAGFRPAAAPPPPHLAGTVSAINTPSAWASRNVFVIAHSAAGRALLPVAAEAGDALGGMIMLATAQGSGLLHKHIFSHGDVWDRPFLTITGDADGQSRWFWYAHHAHELALAAGRMTPRAAAAFKPLVVLPGVNHALTSNGKFKRPYGDVSRPVKDLEASRADIVAAIAAFINTHQACDPATAHTACQQLYALVSTTMKAVAPYTKVLGLGDVSAPFSNSPAGSISGRITAGTPAAGIIPGAAREYGRVLSRALHPGIVAETEAFAVAAQRRLLQAAGLPAEALAHVHIAASVHTDPQALLTHTPRVMKLLPDTTDTQKAMHDEGKTAAARVCGTATGISGGGVVEEPVLLLHMHAALHYTSGGGNPFTAYMRPTAPEYWLKLVAPGGVCQALKDHGVTTAAAPGDGDASTTAHSSPMDHEAAVKALAVSVLDSALAAAPAEVRERYEVYGKQLVVAVERFEEPSNSSDMDRAATTAAPTPAAAPAAPAGASNSCLSNALLRTAAIAFVPMATQQPDNQQQQEQQQGPVAMRIPFCVDATPTVVAGCTGAAPLLGALPELPLVVLPHMDAAAPAGTHTSSGAARNGHEAIHGSLEVSVGSGSSGGGGVGSSGTAAPATAVGGGVVALKLPSVAQLMEWVWLDSLRDIDSPW